MLTMFHPLRLKISDWRFALGEWWKSQRLESRAKSLAKERTLFSLQVLHGDRLNRLKQWTLATESMEENPLFSRRMLDQSLVRERRMCREVDLAIKYKTIDALIDDAAEELERRSAAASADDGASAA